MGVISFDVDGLRVPIIDTDDRMAIHLASGKGYEHETLCAWAAMIVPGTVALDIGAYTGLFSIIAAKRGARAVALEPMPANSFRLAVNADLNKVKIDLYAVAASDFDGISMMNFNPNVPLTTGASLEKGIAAHRDQIATRVVTVDALALNNICAIKLDVERHEVAVLRGAMQTINRFRPPMIIETLNDAARDEIAKVLPAYEVAAILDGRNTLFTPR